MQIRWGFFLIAALIVSGPAFAEDQELKVVDIRRNIPLSDDEPVYKDFYINGGESDGLKKNLVITVVRKIQVHDSGGSHSYGEILAPVGQLRVISITGKVAVAREYKLLSRDDQPMLEQTGIMSGDKVDLTGSFVDNSKPNSKHKAAATPHKESATITAEVSMPPGVIPAAAAMNAAKAAETAKTAPPASAPVAAEPKPASTALGTPAPVSGNSASSASQKLEKTADSGSVPVH